MENKKKQITSPELDVKFIKPNYSEETMLEVIKTPIPPITYMPPVHKEK